LQVDTEAFVRFVVEGQIAEQISHTQLPRAGEVRCRISAMAPTSSNVVTCVPGSGG
jgi:hypothetical protein